jgi:hypothetical protein
MKTLVVVLLMLVAANESFAQLRFAIPLTVTDGVDTHTLYFGFLSGGNFCVVESDSMNGHAEYMLPPMPPSGVFDARFVWPRTGTNATCFDQGTLCDFRPSAAPAYRDTFRIKAQLGSGATMVVSWPSNLNSRFSGATIRFVGSSGVVNTDMMTNTSVDITDAGDPAVATIYTTFIIEDVGENESGLPTAFTLNQNYPNPFNPSTTIRFALPHTTLVTLIVYNMLGQQVAQLVNDQQQAGYHDAVFRGDGLASGMYFYKLVAGDFVQTKKLLLLK